MNANLETLIGSARALDGAWDESRAAKVREGALQSRQRRIQHKKTLRRGIAAAGGVFTICFMFMRAGAVASPAFGAGSPGESTASASSGSSELLAARAVDDAGFTRD